MKTITGLKIMLNSWTFVLLDVKRSQNQFPINFIFRWVIFVQFLLESFNQFTFFKYQTNDGEIFLCWAHHFFPSVYFSYNHFFYLCVFLIIIFSIRVSCRCGQTSFLLVPQLLDRWLFFLSFVFFYSFVFQLEVAFLLTSVCLYV
jgi:hypothetical protein